MIGVEDCPKREDGLPHVWAGVKASDDGNNPCVYCGTPGRMEQVAGQPNFGHFARATAARTELFSRLRQPASVTGWGKAAEK